MESRDSANLLDELKSKDRVHQYTPQKSNTSLLTNILAHKG